MQSNHLLALLIPLAQTTKIMIVLVKCLWVSCVVCAGRAMAVALSNPPKKSGDKGQPKKGVASTKEGEEAMDIANDDSPAKSSKPTRPKPSNPLLFRPSQMRTSRPVGGRKSKTNLQLTSDPPTDSTAARDGKDDSKESDAKQGGDAEKKEAKPLKKKSNADFLKLLMQGKKQ
eukprot:m.65826 g.65826  ORF g.65826 m.65826 type:complete len:173 (+) comp12076_c0_seq2:2465-2983(+)